MLGTFIQATPVCVKLDGLFTHLTMLRTAQRGYQRKFVQNNSILFLEMPCMSIHPLVSSSHFFDAPAQSVIFRGAVQTFFWVNLGFCPNRLDPPPPPPPRTLGHQQLKKSFDVYFAF